VQTRCRSEQPGLADGVRCFFPLIAQAAHG
jgi:hypothetical protein